MVVVEKNGSLKHTLHNDADFDWLDCPSSADRRLIEQGSRPEGLGHPGAQRDPFLRFGRQATLDIENLYRPQIQEELVCAELKLTQEHVGYSGVAAVNYAKLQAKIWCISYYHRLANQNQTGLVSRSVTSLRVQKTYRIGTVPK